MNEIEVIEPKTTQTKKDYPILELSKRTHQIYKTGVVNSNSAQLRLPNAIVGYAAQLFSLEGLENLPDMTPEKIAMEGYNITVLYPEKTEMVLKRAFAEAVKALGKGSGADFLKMWEAFTQGTFAKLRNCDANVTEQKRNEYPIYRGALSLKLKSSVIKGERAIPTVQGIDGETLDNFKDIPVGSIVAPIIAVQVFKSPRAGGALRLGAQLRAVKLIKKAKFASQTDSESLIASIEEEGAMAIDTLI